MEIDLIELGGFIQGSVAANPDADILGPRDTIMAAVDLWLDHSGVDGMSDREFCLAVQKSAEENGHQNFIDWRAKFKAPDTQS